ELLQRDVPRRLVDPVGQLVARLEPGLLGRDEPENRGLPGRQVTQRLEAAVACRVVLEQEGVNREAAQQRLGDRVVRSLGQPAAAGVAPADVEGKGQALPGQAPNARVVRGDDLTE